MSLVMQEQISQEKDNLYKPDFEQVLVGAPLVIPTLFPILRTMIDSNDFFLLRNQMVWNAYCDIADKEQVIDRLTLKNQLGADWQTIDGNMYVSDLMMQIGFHNAVEYAKEVKEASVRRRALTVFDQCKALTTDDSLSVDELLSEYQTGLDTIRTGLAADTTKDSRMIVDEMLELLNESETGVIPTGFARLDENLGGGFRRGNVSYAAASSGLGKTWTAMNIARNVLSMKRVDGRKMRVLFFSLEMTTKTEFNPRFNALESKLNPREIETAGKYIANDANKRKRFTDAIGKIADFDLIVDDRSNVTPSYIRNMVALYKPDMVIIDYLQLLRGDQDFGGNKRLEVTQISHDLKRFAKESRDQDGNPSAFFVLSQLSRSEIKLARQSGKPPTLEALKESGDIENDAAAVVMLWQSETMIADGLIGAAVQKNRFGDGYYGKWMTAPPVMSRDANCGFMKCAGLKVMEISDE